MCRASYSLFAGIAPSAQREYPRGSIAVHGMSKVALLGLAVAFLTSCGSTAIPPASTQEDLRAQCIRDGGRWMPDDARSGYCEYEM